MPAVNELPMSMNASGQEAEATRCHRRADFVGCLQIRWCLALQIAVLLLVQEVKNSTEH